MNALEAQAIGWNHYPIRSRLRRTAGNGYATECPENRRLFSVNEIRIGRNTIANGRPEGKEKVRCERSAARSRNRNQRIVLPKVSLASGTQPATNGVNILWVRLSERHVTGPLTSRQLLVFNSTMELNSAIKRVSIKSAILFQNSIICL